MVVELISSPVVSQQQNATTDSNGKTYIDIINVSEILTTFQYYYLIRIYQQSVKQLYRFRSVKQHHRFGS